MEEAERETDGVCTAGAGGNPPTGALDVTVAK